MHSSTSTMGLALVGALLLTGCSGWDDRQALKNPVLSSDGTAIAGVESFWEAKCNFWSACGVEYTRNYSYKIWTQAKPSQTGITTISASGTSEMFSGRVDSVAYAKNAQTQYLLVVAHEDARYRDTFETGFDREPTYSVRQLVLNPAGTTVTTVRELYRGKVFRYRSCSEGSYSSIDQPLTAHASRDGSQIALAFNKLGCTDATFEVQIFDAATGSELGQTQLDLTGLSADDLSLGGSSSRGWAELSADIADDTFQDALFTHLSTEDTLYNRGLLSDDYQDSKTRFRTRRQTLAEQDTTRQIFVVSLGEFFDNTIDSTHAVEVQNQTVTALRIEGGSAAPIDLGALGTQIANPDSEGAYYFDVVQGCSYGASNCEVQYSTKPELNGVFATVAEEPAAVSIESEFWKIDRYNEFRTQKKTGAYAKSFRFTRVDIESGSVRGVIDCIDTINGYSSEYEPDSPMTLSTCAGWSTGDSDATNPNWPGEDVLWDGKRFAELQWAFDGTGSLRICEVQAMTEANLATKVIDQDNLDSGCDGAAWLTLTEPNRDEPFPTF